jgi:hypothetical protein
MVPPIEGASQHTTDLRLVRQQLEHELALIAELQRVSCGDRSSAVTHMCQGLRLEFSRVPAGA